MKLYFQKAMLHAKYGIRPTPFSRHYFSKGPGKGALICKDGGRIEGLMSLTLNKYAPSPCSH